MRCAIAITTLAAVALAGCGKGGAAVDSTQLAQYVSPAAASNRPPSVGGSANAPTCFTAAQVKSAMGIDMVDLTRGMRNFGEFWNCGYVPTDPAYPGVSVQLTVASAALADSTFDHLTRAMQIARGPNAQPDAIQIGQRAIAYGTPSGAVAAAVSGDRLYIAETMYGTAGPKFTDKKDATIALLRQAVR